MPYQSNNVRTVSGRFTRYYGIFDHVFILLLLILAAGLVTILYFIYRNFLDEKRSAFENEAQYAVKIYGNLIRDELSRVSVNIRKLSENRSVAEFDDEGVRVFKEFFSFLKDGNYVLYLARIGADGTMLCTVPETDLVGKDVADGFSFSETKKGGSPILSEYKKSIFGVKTVQIECPVLDSEGNSMGGICAVLDIDSLARSYLGSAQVRNVGRAWIVDGSGNLILSPVYSEKSLKVSLLTEVRTSLLDEIKKSGDGITKYSLIEKGGSSERLLAFSRIRFGESSSWYVCLDATPDEIFGSLPRFELFEKYYLYPVVSFILMASIIIVGYRMLARYYTGLLREQLCQNQKLETMSLFVNGLAHDFNNIVQLMSGIAFILKENNGQATEKEIKLIQDLSEKSFKLTNQLHNFAKEKQHGLELININTSIQQLLNLIQHVVGRKITVRTELDDRIRAIHMNPVHLEEILMNLCINAHDAMPGGGILTLKTELVTGADAGIGKKDRNYIRLTVSDTGHGVPKDIQKRVFDPFFSTKGNKGTGLGLSTVSMILKEIEGDIRLESPSDKGAKFIVYIPA